METGLQAAACGGKVRNIIVLSFPASHLEDDTQSTISDVGREKYLCEHLKLNNS